MGKNVAVFVDVANIFYAAKAAGVDIDYVTLLKSAVAGRDLVRAYAYTGLDPENENQRNFHAFLARNGYRVVSKDIRKYGDGKVKANLDIELVVDMMKTARNLDVAIVVSGDGDFAPAIRAVQEMGVRVEVISFRGNTSSDLIEVADQFTDITQLAKVERGTRSGRRVAEAEAENLSMTEVPDKLTEGTGAGRGRGRGRGRARVAEVEPVATAAPAPRAGRRPAAIPAAVTAPGAPTGVLPAAPAGAGLVALPGEKLSRAARAAAAAGAAPQEVEAEETEAEEAEAVAAGAAGAAGQAAGGEEGEAGRRRRRRRGGRGRGRGRGREEGAEVTGETMAAEPAPSGRVTHRPPRPEEEFVQPRAPKPTPFGSFWDSQIGMPKAPVANLAALSEEELEEEPEIPEYLIAEQRRGRPGQAGGRGGQAGGRGGRSAYTAAIERERYGRGGGVGSGGLNRYPDVSGRGARPAGPRREETRRGERPVVTPRADRSARGEEPWSEVPPELEEMLRAQLAQRAPKAAPAKPRPEAAPAEASAPAAPAEAPAPKRRTT
ncbi:MAG: NYN domain-containing protein, partial [Chloroflexota bacterium]